MSKKEFNKLIEVYGMDKAEQAWAWFMETYSESFRKSVHPALFCMSNEYLWKDFDGSKVAA
jgi:hypothetical protein